MFLFRDVVMGDLETAESRLDNAYAASEKEKNLRYVYKTKNTYMYICTLPVYILCVIL